ncbi:hypothetical protein ACOME3_001229 [Neoechinorhynchus agilis]
MLAKLYVCLKYPKQVRKLFEQCDMDKDGFLCFEEVQRMLVLFKMYDSDHQVELIMKSFGADNSGKIDLEHFYRIYKISKSGNEKRETQMNESLAFSVFDRNDDGLITLT